MREYMFAVIDTCTQLRKLFKSYESGSIRIQEYLDAMHTKKLITEKEYLNVWKRFLPF